jgi:chromate reductase
VTIPTHSFVCCVVERRDKLTKIFMPIYHLVAISGSLRKGSYNTELIRAFKKRAPEGVTVEIIDIGELPLYNQDMEANLPQLVTELKNKVKAADGVIISTPEYNRTVPGTLKNAVDWLSRPYGGSAWNLKPVFIASASGGAIGGALAAANLRQAFAFLNAYVLGQPEFYLGNANTKFDEQGNLIDEETQKRIDQALASFTAFIDKVR